MASENFQDLNLCFDVASPHNIQQIETSNRRFCETPNKLPEYRFIEGVENESPSNLQIENNIDVNNSKRVANEEHDKHHDPAKSSALLDHKTPKLGMEFNDVEAAYKFYNRYGEKMGSGLRNHNIKTARGVVKFCSFCCSKEGFCGVNKRGAKVVNHRPETRTGCRATMHIKLQKNGKFKITKLELEHNHTLACPGKTHMLRSHRKVGKVQKCLIDASDKCGLTPKQAFDFQATVTDGRENLGCLPAYVKDYLRTKRQKEMEKGDVASLMQYFHEKQLENKSFYSTFHIDNKEQTTNIFWTDAKGIVDYSHFGDVV